MWGQCTGTNDKGDLYMSTRIEKNTYSSSSWTFISYTNLSSLSSFATNKAPETVLLEPKHVLTLMSILGCASIPPAPQCRCTDLWPDLQCEVESGLLHVKIIPRYTHNKGMAEITWYLVEVSRPSCCEGWTERHRDILTGQQIWLRGKERD